MLALFAALIAFMLVPTTMSAQGRNDLFFHYDNDDIYEDRTEGGITLGNFGIGEEAPLGSGVVVMLLAGAGYVALKKKED